MQNTDKSNFKVQRTFKIHSHKSYNMSPQQSDWQYKLNMIKFVLASTEPCGVYICKEYIQTQNIKKET